MLSHHFSGRLLLLSASKLETEKTHTVTWFRAFFTLVESFRPCKPRASQSVPLQPMASIWSERLNSLSRDYDASGAGAALPRDRQQHRVRPHGGGLGGAVSQHAVRLHGPVSSFIPPQDPGSEQRGVVLRRRQRYRNNVVTTQRMAARAPYRNVGRSPSAIGHVQ